MFIFLIGITYWYQNLFISTNDHSVDFYIFTLLDVVLTKVMVLIVIILKIIITIIWCMMVFMVVMKNSLIKLLDELEHKNLSLS